MVILLHILKKKVHRFKKNYLVGQYPNIKGESQTPSVEAGVQKAGVCQGERRPVQP